MFFLARQLCRVLALLACGMCLAVFGGPTQSTLAHEPCECRQSHGVSCDPPLGDQARDSSTSEEEDDDQDDELEQSVATVHVSQRFKSRAPSARVRSFPAFSRAIHTLSELEPRPPRQA